MDSILHRVFLCLIILESQSLGFLDFLPITSDSIPLHKLINQSLNFELPELPIRDSPQIQSSTSLSRIIDTKYGKLQGLIITPFPSGSHQAKNNNHPLRNKIVEVFLSIPYASPPVKSARFSPTQTPIPWDGVRIAVKPGFVCPQVLPDIRDESGALKDMPRGYLEYLRKVEPYLRNQSEDCLYLNVFAPPLPSNPGGESDASSNSGKLLRPVLVFIHGGKFSWGSGNLYDGSLLVVSTDIIFVTINYRLGVLGFLNVNPSPLTRPRVANYGLMDQIAALHWIKENILAFGGDPDSITLMGYESGAASIHFLMSSPAVMDGLFHRAILIAGSAHAPWALIEDPSSVAGALGEALNCSNPHKESNSIPSSTSTNRSGEWIIDCLKNKHFSYFSKFHPPKFSIDFGPSIDGIVIRPNFKGGIPDSDPSMNGGKKDLAAKYDLLFGISSSEMLTTFSETDLAVGFESLRRDAILRTLVRNSYRFHLNEILATITNEYIDWERSPQHPIATRDLTLAAITDALSLAPVISASDSSKISRSYFYVFDHTTKEGLYNSYQQRVGAGGGEELIYLFGFPIIEHGSHGITPFLPYPIPSNFSRVEMALSELMMTQLSNFIKTGDPNEPVKFDLLTWPISKERNKFRALIWEPYDRLHQKYLEFTTNKIRTRSHFRAHQMAIWMRLIPELQRTGAQYASVLHNRLRGGYNPTLYVGSLHLPQELESVLLDPQSGLDSEVGLIVDWLGSHGGSPGGNGSLVNYGLGNPPPSPPTTCYSPSLSSLASSESASRSAVATSSNSTASTSSRSSSSVPSTSTTTTTSSFSPYTTALSLTIAIGCSLLILNVFIFALVYYHRDKRRMEEVLRRRNCPTTAGTDISTGHPGPPSDPELCNFRSDPPELVKSNIVQSSPFNIGQSPSYGQGGNDVELHCGLEGVVVSPSESCFYSDVSDVIPSANLGIKNKSGPGKGVHFSLDECRLENDERSRGQYSRILTSPNTSQGESTISSQQVLGIATLSKLPNSSVNSNTSLTLLSGNGPSAANHITPTGNTISRKPQPPTRNFTNTISQRQIFSLIMSLMTMGIL